MTNNIKLDKSIVGLSLDFEHACGIATCLLLAEDKLSQDEIICKILDFSRLVNQMKGLKLRIEELAQASDGHKENVEVEVVKDVILTHKYLDNDIWKLVESIKIGWGTPNQYDDAFYDGLHGLSNLLKRIDDGLNKIVNVDVEFDEAA